jgi:hypothetical protein
VGVYTYDQAVMGYGPPYYGRAYCGPVWGGYSSTYFPAQFLRLTFSLDCKLKAWKEFSK